MFIDSLRILSKIHVCTPNSVPKATLPGFQQKRYKIEMNLCDIKKARRNGSMLNSDSYEKLFTEPLLSCISNNDVTVTRNRMHICMS